MIQYFCCSEVRRKLVSDSALNGIDYLEVDDDRTKPASGRQRRLFVRFLKDLTPGVLTTGNVRLEGGETVRQFTVESLAVDGSLLTVTLDHPGDFSRYTLRLVASSSSDEPPTGFDLLLSAVDFSFKVNCETDFDCEEQPQCPQERFQEPDINTLARDFNSFRQLMTDRLSVLIPNWQEQSVADLMHALIDLKAYLADYQSYQQDAVATEAYLGTARRRISVRRHARLADYPMHDGCNARVWVQVKIDPALGPDAAVALPAKTQLLTRVTGLPQRQGQNKNVAVYRQTLESGPVVFETMHEATLYGRHNRICFYSWGDRNCCLPRGATCATLEGHFPNLCEGDVLVFEEVRGPETGKKADRDPMHRHAVRLTKVQPKSDPVEDPPVPVTEIRWHPSDALLFPLCIASDAAMKEKDEDHDETCPKAVSVALGNVVLADHGRTIPKEDLGLVPPVRFHYAESRAFCEESEPKTIPPRFRPRLKEGPLTQAAPLQGLLVSLDFLPAYATRLDSGEVPVRVLDRLSALRTIIDKSLLEVEKRPNGWIIRNRDAPYVVRREIVEQNGSPVEKLNVYDYPPVAASVRTAPQLALPAITLESLEEEVPFQWLPQRDLLNSSVDARTFVAEVESLGSTWLRFGDDRFGKRPNAESRFHATYRIGNGPGGNIGAEAIRHIVSGEAAIVSVRNPLSAQGGTEAEASEEVRLKAPHAYRVQERAVTPEDYAAIAQRHPEVQRAVATFRWTGSWYTVFLTVDRFGGREIDQAFERSVRDHMERYRMAGYDMEVDAPHYVPLEIAMEVCVLLEYFRSEVRRDLLGLFSNRALPDGRLGVFHPDNLTFGQTVHLSRLYATAESVTGVESVTITTFQKQDKPALIGLDSGKLTLGTREIARLDNDPNFPKRGVLRLKMKGGK